MNSTGQEFFEDSESYLSELSNDKLDFPIDCLNVINKSIFDSFEVVADISLAAINVAVLAVSSPDCGVSVVETEHLN